MNATIADVINTSIFKSIIIVSIPFGIISAIILFFIQDKKIKDLEHNLGQIGQNFVQNLGQNLGQLGQTFVKENNLIISKVIEILENNTEAVKQVEKKMQTEINSLNTKTKAPESLEHDIKVAEGNIKLTGQIAEGNIKLTGQIAEGNINNIKYQLEEKMRELNARIDQLSGRNLER